jgi:hypothetical protein
MDTHDPSRPAGFPKPLVGVTYKPVMSHGDEDLLHDLKSRLLLFDEIYMNEGFKPSLLHPTVHQLAEYGIIRLAKVKVQLQIGQIEAEGRELDLDVSVIEDDIATIQDSITRAWARMLDEPWSRDKEVVPLCWFHRRKVEDSKTSLDNVVEVILRAIPCPRADVPIEQILDFRADEEARTKLRRLRFWMRKLAREEAREREIVEELEELLFEYEEQMKIHRLKYEMNTWRVLLSTTAEVFESLARLKPKSAIDALFAVKEQRIKLLEAEASTIGKEVAYIWSAKRQFDE